MELFISDGFGSKQWRLPVDMHALINQLLHTQFFSDNDTNTDLLDTVRNHPIPHITGSDSRINLRKHIGCPGQ